MNGGIVTFEWPRHCLGWMFKELLLFILKWRMFVIDIDGCACGMTDANGVPFLKQWRFVSSDPRVAQSLGGRPIYTQLLERTMKLSMRRKREETARKAMSRVTAKEPK